MSNRLSPEAAAFVRKDVRSTSHAVSEQATYMFKQVNEMLVGYDHSDDFDLRMVATEALRHLHEALVDLSRLEDLAAKRTFEAL